MGRPIAPGRELFEVLFRAVHKAFRDRAQVGDTEKGVEIRREVEVLEELLAADEENAVVETAEESA